MQQTEGDGPTFMNSNLSLDAEIGFQLTHYIGESAKREEILSSTNFTQYRGLAKRWGDNHLNFDGRNLTADGSLGNRLKGFDIQRINNNYATFYSPDASDLTEFQCENFGSEKVKVSDAGESSVQSPEVEE